MRKLLYLAAVMMLSASCAWATDFKDETLQYKVMYKWGLINKQAGSVDVSLKNEKGNYDCQLTGTSAKWADKFFKVRDTLNCVIKKEGFEPVFYEKIAHEGGDNKHDQVVYHRDGNTVIGQCSRYETKDGKVKKDEKRTLEATGTTVDMLSAYYYMRNLPYEKWEPGQVVSINIFSGKRKELLTIKYHGVETVEYDDHKYSCYKITFIFTSDGKKKTSDDMFAWITTNSQRLPVKLEGKLPIGSVKCFMTDVK